MSLIRLTIFCSITLILCMLLGCGQPSENKIREITSVSPSEFLGPSGINLGNLVTLKGQVREQFGNQFKLMTEIQSNIASKTYSCENLSQEYSPEAPVNGQYLEITGFERCRQLGHSHEVSRYIDDRRRKIAQKEGKESDPSANEGNLRMSVIFEVLEINKL
ncbi:MAG: hypothetical protein WCH01_22870 [Methylococcaceae bacterium]